MWSSTTIGITVIHKLYYPCTSKLLSARQLLFTSLLAAPYSVRTLTMACGDCSCTGSHFFHDANPSSPLATIGEIKENIRIIEIHRMLVYAIGKTVYPEYDFIAHDLSKFSSQELIPYTIKFIQKKPDCDNAGWDDALKHHYAHNLHHPQYWNGVSMPEMYLKESIVDMVAAKYQYQTGKERLGDHLERDMFDLKEYYLDRYISDDRQKVKDELNRLLAINWETIPVVGKNFAKTQNTATEV